MSVVAVCGLPGSGKTLFTTYLAMKQYKRLNRFNFSKEKKNYIYSNYPIKLDKKHYSKAVGLSDLSLNNSWETGSTIMLDEIQLYFDSLEFKDFPKTIRNAFQLHRHFGISDIYINSQHPSRIVKQVRVLVSKFYDILKFIKIPFTPWCLFIYNVYYNADDFGKSVKVNKSDVSYKFSKCHLFMNYKKVYKAYDTIYMNNLVSDKPVYDSKEFNSKVMSKSDINDVFDITDEDDVKILKRVKKSEKARIEQISAISSFQDNQKSSSSKDNANFDNVSVLSEVVEKVNQPLDNRVVSTFQEVPNKQVKDLQENDFIKWSPVGNEPIEDIFSLIDDIESNDNSEKKDSIKSGLDSFW